ncbi:hypothetical protein UPYG_G00275180 [Umbra pygmaea]|uniref:Uncharacterized protein n=1 Tax=Umbra pygmaea TaxID=75934 RepID=A0ABD0WL41_UMBPY
MDIFLLPSLGSFAVVNLTEEVTHYFQLTCFDELEGVYRSQSIEAVPGFPSTSVYMDSPNSTAHLNNTDSVTGSMFGSLGAGFALIIIYGLCRKWWLRNERLRDVF